MHVSLGRLTLAPVLGLGLALASASVATPASAQSTTTKTDGKKTDAKKADDKKGAAKTEEKKTETDAAAKKDETAAAATTTPEGGPDAESKRALLVNIEFGITRVDLAGFSDSLSFDKTAANGLTYGFGAGMRFDNLRLGARFRSHSTTEFTMWSLLAEVGYGIKLKPLEPVFSLHAGYAWNQSIERATISGSLPPGNFLTPDVNLHTFVVGGEVNALYHATETIRVGPYLGFDLLVVQRDKVGLPQTIFPNNSTADDSAKPLYNDTGSGLGYNLSLGIRGVLDFGF